MSLLRARVDVTPSPPPFLVPIKFLDKEVAIECLQVMEDNRHVIWELVPQVPFDVGGVPKIPSEMVVILHYLLAFVER